MGKGGLGARVIDMRHGERVEKAIEMIENGRNNDEIVSFFRQSEGSSEGFSELRTRQQIESLRIFIGRKHR